MSKNLNIYMLSDASGETVEIVVEAATAQFADLEFSAHLKPLIRSKEAVDIAILEIMKNPGLILCTFANSDLRNYINSQCIQFKIPILFILEHVVNKISEVTGLTPSVSNKPGKHKILDESYYRKIDLLNFALQHDDGHDISGYNEADIVLLGVSRTSKSPTALCLAQRGYKVANLPIINGIDIDLSKVYTPMIVGLTISPDILTHIRSHRLMSCNVTLHTNNASYAERQAIIDELAYARYIFREYGINVIDVSRKAVEEVAAEIINLYKNFSTPSVATSKPLGN